MRASEFVTLALAMGLMGGSVSGATDTAAQDVYAVTPPEMSVRDKRMGWWREARLGVFIHYGLYSGLGGVYKGKKAGGEWIQCNVGANTEEYAAEALPLFKPQPGCVEKWMDLAKKAGCRYAVLTSKHHEGFALFDTKTSDYTSVKVAGRDFAREFVDACRSRNMRVGFYHSVIDWHHPDYDNTICPDLCYPKGQAQMLKDKGIPRNQDSYCRYMHTQVRELMENYGPVDIMWWDYSQGAAEGDRAWKATDLVKMCRTINPGVIMNNRLFGASSLNGERPGTYGASDAHGDFYTPEKCLPEKVQVGDDWETCLTVGHHWGYSINDGNFKSPALVIRILQACSAMGGNLLLNIGPKVDGSIPEPIVKVFETLGEWMAVNQEAIYGSQPVWDKQVPQEVMMNRVLDDYYVFLPYAPPVEEEAAANEAPAEEDTVAAEETVEESEDADDCYVLRFKGSTFNAIQPSIVGQPDCVVEMRRVEKAREGDEPEVFLEFHIPYSAWDNAVEGLPVLKLSDAS